MKTVRSVTFVLVFFIVFSVWKPTTAFAAGAEASQAGINRPALVNLTVVNRTFGALEVTLDGSGGFYSFYVAQGKTTFQIVPGKYTYTVRFAPNSLCRNWFSPKYKAYLVKTGKFVNLKNALGPYHLCTLG